MATLGELTLLTSRRVRRHTAPPIIVQLLGGLGNQMFQYALGRSLSLRHGARLLVDVSVLLDHRPGRHLTPRSYALDIFKLDVRFATRSDVRRYHPHGAGLTGKAIFHLRKRIAGEQSIVEKEFCFDPDVLDVRPPVYLAGLWQSPRYFIEHEQILRNDFRFHHTLPASAQAIARDLSVPGSVCLHVRRGDYVSVQQNASLMGFVGIEYYKRAVEHIRNYIERPRFFVFSDDMLWCRRNLTWFGGDSTFVLLEIPKDMEAHAVDLHLMSMAENFILANSTFSWWGAWLAGARAKLVIAPENWFRARDLRADDLVPADWVRL